MYRTLARSMLPGVLTLVLIAPGSAGAATTPTAFVRVEGAGATLVPQTLVKTTSATTVRGHSCPASSALGAMSIATQGKWAGKFEIGAGFADFFVQGILGEAPAGNNFWTLWVNGRSSSTGGCATHLHADDHVLWFDCVADSNFNCIDDPLKLTVPARIKLGKTVTASATRLDGNGHGTATREAEIRGNGVLAVTGKGGQASLVAHHTGVIELQALKSGATPSDPVLVCVYRHSPSQCGSLSSGPAVHVNGIHEHQVFTTGPRELHGTVGPDSAGLADVSLSLLRHHDGHCSFLDGNRGTWQASPCGKRVPTFSLGSSASWSYLLPKRLAPGTYRLHVVATDGNGRKTKPITGASVVDFEVK